MGSGGGRVSFKANVTTDTRKHAKLRCQRHGKLRWRGDVVCEKCERVYLRDETSGGPGEAKIVIFPSAPESGNCDCGVRLFPKHENEDGARARHGRVLLRARDLRALRELEAVVIRITAMNDGWTLEGEDADRFVAEMKRVDALPPDSEEARKRRAFLAECERVYRMSQGRTK